MRNPALMAASLAGRPLLMRPDAVAQYARLAGVEALRDERRSPFATLLGRARRFIGAQAEDTPPDVGEAMAYLPRWMGEADAIGCGWSLKEGIAVINVDGPLMAEGYVYGDYCWHGYDTLLQACEEAYSDARVGGVFFRKNSPGGVCAPGLRELADFIRANRASSGGKPTWAFCEGSYSADYWTSSSCDQVVAPREGGVGSIGAVMTHCDVSGMLDKDGVVVTPIQFGGKKTDGAAFKPLSDTAKADLQAEVDQFGRWFVAAVHEGRPNLSEQAILDTQAGVFLGDSDVPALSGLAQGLVDQVLTEREAFAALLALVKAPISPAAPPHPAARMEKDMKRDDVTAAAKAAGLTEAQTAAVLANLPTAEASGDDTEGDTAEGGDTVEGGAGEDSVEASGGGDTVEGGAATDALAPAGATVLAILDLPEAKGREKLAKELAKQPGMTTASAKALLSAAPKASALKPEDPPVGASGGQVAGSTEFEQGKALGASLKALRGGK